MQEQTTPQTPASDLQELLKEIKELKAGLLVNSVTHDNPTFEGPPWANQQALQGGMRIDDHADDFDESLEDLVARDSGLQYILSPQAEAQVARSSQHFEPGSFSLAAAAPGIGRSIGSGFSTTSVVAATTENSFSPGSSDPAASAVAQRAPSADGFAHRTPVTSCDPNALAAAPASIASPNATHASAPSAATGAVGSTGKGRQVASSTPATATRSKIGSRIARVGAAVAATTSMARTPLSNNPTMGYTSRNGSHTQPNPPPPSPPTSTAAAALSAALLAPQGSTPALPRTTRPKAVAAVAAMTTAGRNSPRTSGRTASTGPSPASSVVLATRSSTGSAGSSNSSSALSAATALGVSVRKRPEMNTVTAARKVGIMTGSHCVPLAAAAAAQTGQPGKAGSPTKLAGTGPAAPAAPGAAGKTTARSPRPNAASAHSPPTSPPQKRPAAAVAAVTAKRPTVEILSPPAAASAAAAAASMAAAADSELECEDSSRSLTLPVVANALDVMAGESLEDMLAGDPWLAASTQADADDGDAITIGAAAPCASTYKRPTSDELLRPLTMAAMANVPGSNDWLDEDVDAEMNLLMQGGAGVGYGGGFEAAKPVVGTAVAATAATEYTSTPSSPPLLHDAAVFAATPSPLMRGGLLGSTAIEALAPVSLRCSQEPVRSTVCKVRELLGMVEAPRQQDNPELDSEELWRNITTDANTFFAEHGTEGQLCSSAGTFPPARSTADAVAAAVAMSPVPSPPISPAAALRVEGGCLSAEELADAVGAMPYDSLETDDGFLSDILAAEAAAAAAAVVAAGSPAMTTAAVMQMDGQSSGEAADEPSAASRRLLYQSSNASSFGFDAAVAFEATLISRQLAGGAPGLPPAHVGGEDAIIEGDEASSAAATPRQAATPLAMVGAKASQEEGSDMAMDFGELEGLTSAAAAASGGKGRAMGMGGKLDEVAVEGWESWGGVERRKPDTPRSVSAVAATVAEAGMAKDVEAEVIVPDEPGMALATAAPGVLLAADEALPAAIYRTMAPLAFAAGRAPGLAAATADDAADRAEAAGGLMSLTSVVAKTSTPSAPSAPMEAQSGDPPPEADDDDDDARMDIAVETGAAATAAAESDAATSPCTPLAPVAVAMAAAMAVQEVEVMERAADDQDGEEVTSTMEPSLTEAAEMGVAEAAALPAFGQPTEDVDVDACGSGAAEAVADPDVALLLEAGTSSAASAVDAASMSTDGEPSHDVAVSRLAGGDCAEAASGGARRPLVVVSALEQGTTTALLGSVPTVLSPRSPAVASACFTAGPAAALDVTAPVPVPLTDQGASPAARHPETVMEAMAIPMDALPSPPALAAGAVPLPKASELQQESSEHVQEPGACPGAEVKEEVLAEEAASAGSAIVAIGNAQSERGLDGGMVPEVAAVPSTSMDESRGQVNSPARMEVGDEIEADPTLRLLSALAVDGLGLAAASAAAAEKPQAAPQAPTPLAESLGMQTEQQAFSEGRTALWTGLDSHGTAVAAAAGFDAVGTNPDADATVGMEIEDGMPLAALMPVAGSAVIPDADGGKAVAAHCSYGTDEGAAREDVAAASGESPRSGCHLDGAALPPAAAAAAAAEPAAGGDEAFSSKAAGAAAASGGASTAEAGTEVFDAAAGDKGSYAVDAADMHSSGSCSGGNGDDSADQQMYDAEEDSFEVRQASAKDGQLLLRPELPTPCQQSIGDDAYNGADLLDELRHKVPAGADASAAAVMGSPAASLSKRVVVRRGLVAASEGAMANACAAVGADAPEGDCAVDGPAAGVARKRARLTSQGPAPEGDEVDATASGTGQGADEGDEIDAASGTGSAADEVNLASGVAGEVEIGVLTARTEHIAADIGVDRAKPNEAQAVPTWPATLVRQTSPGHDVHGRRMPPTSKSAGSPASSGASSVNARESDAANPAAVAVAAATEDQICVTAAPTAEAWGSSGGQAGAAPTVILPAASGANAWADSALAPTPCPSVVPLRHTGCTSRVSIGVTDEAVLQTPVVIASRTASLPASPRTGPKRPPLPEVPEIPCQADDDPQSLLHAWQVLVPTSPSSHQGEADGTASSRGSLAGLKSLRSMLSGSSRLSRVSSNRDGEAADAEAAHGKDATGADVAVDASPTAAAQAAFAGVATAATVCPRAAAIARASEGQAEHDAGVPSSSDVETPSKVMPSTGWPVDAVTEYSGPASPFTKGDADLGDDATSSTAVTGQITAGQGFPPDVGGTATGRSSMAGAAPHIKKPTGGSLTDGDEEEGGEEQLLPTWKLAAAAPPTAGSDGTNASNVSAAVAQSFLGVRRSVCGAQATSAGSRLKRSSSHSSASASAAEPLDVPTDPATSEAAPGSPGLLTGIARQAASCTHGSGPVAAAAGGGGGGDAAAAAAPEHDSNDEGTLSPAWKVMELPAAAAGDSPDVVVSARCFSLGAQPSLRFCRAGSSRLRRASAPDADDLDFKDTVGGDELPGADTAAAAPEQEDVKGLISAAAALPSSGTTTTTTTNFGDVVETGAVLALRKSHSRTCHAINADVAVEQPIATSYSADGWASPQLLRGGSMGRMGSLNVGKSLRRLEANGSPLRAGVSESGSMSGSWMARVSSRRVVSDAVGSVPLPRRSVGGGDPHVDALRPAWQVLPLPVSPGSPDSGAGGSPGAAPSAANMLASLRSSSRLSRMSSGIPEDLLADLRVQAYAAVGHLQGAPHGDDSGGGLADMNASMEDSDVHVQLPPGTAIAAPVADGPYTGDDTVGVLHAWKLLPPRVPAPSTAGLAPVEAHAGPAAGSAPLLPMPRSLGAGRPVLATTRMGNNQSSRLAVASSKPLQVSFETLSPSTQYVGKEAVPEPGEEDRDSEDNGEEEEGQGEEEEADGKATPAATTAAAAEPQAVTMTATVATGEGDGGAVVHAWKLVPPSPSTSTSGSASGTPPGTGTAAAVAAAATGLIISQGGSSGAVAATAMTAAAPRSQHAFGSRPSLKSLGSLRGSRLSRTSLAVEDYVDESYTDSPAAAGPTDSDGGDDGGGTAGGAERHSADRIAPANEANQGAIAAAAAAAAAAASEFAARDTLSEPFTTAVAALPPPPQPSLSERSSAPAIIGSLQPGVLYSIDARTYGGHQLNPCAIPRDGDLPLEDGVPVPGSPIARALSSRPSLRSSRSSNSSRLSRVSSARDGGAAAAALLSNIREDDCEGQTLSAGIGTGPGAQDPEAADGAPLHEQELTALELVHALTSKPATTAATVVAATGGTGAGHSAGLEPPGFKGSVTSPAVLQRITRSCSPSSRSLSSMISQAPESGLEGIAEEGTEGGAAASGQAASAGAAAPAPAAADNETSECSGVPAYDRVSSGRAPPPAPSAGAARIGSPAAVVAAAVPPALAGPHGGTRSAQPGLSAQGTALRPSSGEDDAESDALVPAWKVLVPAGGGLVADDARDSDTGGERASPSAPPGATRQSSLRMHRFSSSRLRRVTVGTDEPAGEASSGNAADASAVAAAATADGAGHNIAVDSRATVAEAGAGTASGAASGNDLSTGDSAAGHGSHMQAVPGIDTVTVTTRGDNMTPADLPSARFEPGSSPSTTTGGIPMGLAGISSSSVPQPPPVSAAATASTARPAEDAISEDTPAVPTSPALGAAVGGDLGVVPAAAVVSVRRAHRSHVGALPGPQPAETQVGARTRMDRGSGSGPEIKLPAQSPQSPARRGLLSCLVCFSGSAASD